MTTGTAEADQIAQDGPGPAGAPYGLDPDGRAYTSDPGPLRGMLRRSPTGRAKRTSTRAPRAPRAPRKTAAPKSAPAKSAPAKSDQLSHGQKAAQAVRAGAVFLRRRNPVDGAIVAGAAGEVGQLVDELVAEMPSLGKWIDRLSMPGGARGKAAAMAGVVGAAVAINHGYRHPALLMVGGGLLQAAYIEATLDEYRRARTGAPTAAGPVHPFADALGDAWAHEGIEPGELAAVRAIYDRLTAPPAVVDVDQADEPVTSTG